jgi:sugar transferase (PEP-CTERM/EpsH1 system associated)
VSSADRLRILIVTPSLPYPPSWGFGIRVYQIVRYLAARHQVTLIAQAEPHEEDKVEALRGTGARVHAVVRDSRPISAKRASQLISLFAPTSYQRRGLQSHEMQSTLDRVLTEESFDIIQIESSQLSGFRFHGNTPLIIDEHNIEYELLYRTYTTERSPLRKVYNLAEFIKFRNEEQRSWKQADGCILTSDREEAILRKISPRTPTTVVPNGVDTDFFQPSPVPRGSASMVFVGVMHYRPNVDAAMYFAREILPTIVRQRPTAKFVIVGGGAPEELTRIAGPNLILTGVVPDTRPYLRDAGVVVVPMRMGSGTRLKVLEGMAVGRPLISTSLGYEGILAEHEKHLLVADDASTFAGAVVRALSDHQLADRLAAGGRELVEQRYAWTSVLQRLEAFLLSRARCRDTRTLP